MKTDLEEMAEHGKPDDEGAEMKDKGKIRHMHIHVLDDGSYHLRSETDKGHSQETSHSNPRELLSAIHDNVTSPHLPKLGTGERFDALSSKLSQQKGVNNPDALAAYRRKKYGNSGFAKLSAGGR